MPVDFIQLPSSKSWGKLAGMAVRKEIYKDLVPIFSKFKDSNTISRSLNAIIKIETQGMQLFKIFKVTVNPRQCSGIQFQEWFSLIGAVFHCKMFRFI